MQNGASTSRNDLSSGAIDALLRGLSAADAAAAQAAIDHLIQSAVSDAEARHQREALALQEAFQREVLAAQEAYQREILAAQESHQLEIVATQAAHQQNMREAHEAYQQHIQSLFEHIRLSRQRLFGRRSEAHAGQNDARWLRERQREEQLLAEVSRQAALRFRGEPV